MKFISLFIFLLFFPFQNAQGDREVDYFTLALRIFESLEAECFPELNNSYSQRMIFEKDKKYPWLTDSVGKGINDIGDEVECLNSLKNTTFFMVNFNDMNLSQILENDQYLMKFLEIRNFSLGICIMTNCSEAFKRYVPIIGDFINFIASNKNSENKNLVSFIEHSDNSNPINKSNESNPSENETLCIKINEEKYATKNSKKAFLIILLVWGIIKIVAGIIRIISIPKGYDKYVAEKINRINSEEHIDIEEKTNLAQKAKFNEPINEESNTQEYNPLFDFSEQLPIYIRILRFFDIINDIHYLSSKRNRYYNDNGLDIITFNKAIVIFFLVFSHTFSALISLPSEEIINASFFKSILNILYRLSNNALICWGFLEGAYTTYKLLSFISSEMFLYYAKIDRKQVSIFIKLFIIYGKFLILQIPRCGTFFAVFFLFYYKVEDFRFLVEGKATYHHIITYIFKHNITCDGTGHIFQNSFSLNIDKYNSCYEFTFFYLNLFLCTAISMVIIYLFFVFRNKFFEIFAIIGNLFVFFFFTFRIHDQRDSVKGYDMINHNYIDLLLHYHVKGETYSTKIFQCFIGFYFLGFILGCLLFNHDSLRTRINRLIYEYNGIHLTKVNTKKKEDLDISLNEPLSENGENELSLDSSRITENLVKIENNDKSISEESSSDYYINYMLPYYPLSFLNPIIRSIDSKLTFANKIIIIIVGVILLVILNGYLVLHVHFSEIFQIKLTPAKRNFFCIEKHIFVLIYFLMLVIMITLPKTGSLRKFMTSKICITISRLGFLISCVSHEFTFLTFFVFSLKVKLYVPTFIIISFGNFLGFFVVCILLNIITELPLRLIVKKILRIGRKKESIII